jgi:phosphatidylinositol-3-phosphatase
MSLSRSVRLNAGIFFFPTALLLAACGGSGSSGNATGDDGSDGGGGADSSGGGIDGGGGNDSGGTTTDGGTTNHDGGQTGGDGSTGSDGSTTTTHAIKTVFLILMENNDWSLIKGSSSAPYINNLLTTAAYAENYHNPPGLHPSEPNYIWLESGFNYGIMTDDDPSTNELSTTTVATHLVNQLEAANVTWKTYVEGISGTTCPVTSSGLYAAKHTPFVFFDDVTDTGSMTAARCIAHVRPYTELATDITANTVPQYNFITPNLCDDMHGASGCTAAQTADEIKAGDTWLSTEIPKIMASSAYMNGGAIFITWDEGETAAGVDDNPIGMIVLSPFAKVGYPNTTTRYDHSSTLKTNEEIFGVSLIQGAADSMTSDLSDLFTTFP